MRRRISDFAFVAVLSIVWTWPLARHFRDRIPGGPGDNFSFLWNLWWMRQVLSHRALSFFHSPYLFSPFGVDLVNHPHTALQGLISATLLSKLSIVVAENLYIIVSIFLNAAAAYALVYDMTRERRLALVAAVAFGDSPYFAAHLMGHFDLLTAWVIPLFALFLRRALRDGSWKAAIVCGLCAAVAAYSAYYYVAYLALFSVAYTVAWWDLCHLDVRRRAESAAALSIRLLAVGVIALDLFVMFWIGLTGGTSVKFIGREISVRGLQNPLLVMWALVAIWILARWRFRVRVDRLPAERFWPGAQALLVTAAVFAVLALPLISQTVRLVAAGRYVTQRYFWRSAPAGIDLASFVAGNPFHPVFGGIASLVYRTFYLDRIDGVGWLGVVPLIVLLTWRGRWGDSAEARRWKIVLAVFAIWALGPFLMAAGVNLGLPLPETLVRFIPIVDNARMPGRAMVGVYLALAVLMGLRLAGLTHGSTPRVRPAIQWALLALLAFDYLSAPVRLTDLDRPIVYQRLAAIQDDAPVIEVPFGIGDGLTEGLGAQDRRILYYATIHGHPLVGGFIGRMPPGVAQAYQSMPIVGNLLRLSSGQTSAQEEEVVAGVPFRYLVLDTVAASPELIAYVHSALDVDLLEQAGGRELYAVQGAKPPIVRASR
ncbi:MAG TPA: hypothetical protein VGZ27_03215 [Vicinamibacterales bacterium]|nr:hypothetical protein [Vicinamibacterales bacterium]